MDELDITSRRGNGTHIVCRRWLREHRPSVRPCPLAFGVATRPRRLSQVNGDAFVVSQWAESALVGVIDGLGHGQFAHRAAQTARQYVENHFDLPLDQIFRGVGRACRATRGVVMALARFDWGQERLSFASVGNILVRVFPALRAVSLHDSPRRHRPECARRGGHGTCLVARPGAGAPFRRRGHALGLERFPRLGGAAGRGHGPGAIAREGQRRGRCHGDCGQET